jgi:hypothetical protein
MAGDRLEGAGEADGLLKVITSPLFGSLIIILACCRCGILKSAVGVGAGLLA